MQQVLWKKHFEELYGTVKDILHLHAYEDCTIVCEGELFRAHRFLLASVSPYFHKIFSQNETNTTGKFFFLNVAIVKFNSVKFNCVVTSFIGVGQ